MAIFTKTNYTKKYCLLHPWEVIIHKCHDIRNAWQRATKGYCSEDVYNMDSWFLETIPKMLDEFIKNHYSHPTDITDDEWNKILNKMAKAFRNASEATTEFENPYESDYLLSIDVDLKNMVFNSTADEELKNNYHKAEDSKQTLMQKSFDEGIEHFHKYFYHLWD